MFQKLYSIKFLLLLIGLLIRPIDFYAQCNLVLNPGAETGPCPTNQDQVPNATSWNRAGGSADYFGKTCTETWTASYFRACSDRMIGFYTEWTPYNSQTPEYREYAQVQLASPLVAGTRYCVSFYTRLAGNMGGINTATDNLGAYFTTTAVTAPPPGNGPYNITPQIESPKGAPIVAASGWVLVSGSFIAAGGERYVTFGNFHNLANTTYSSKSASMRSYYFIDDILVKDCNASCTFNANVTPANTTVCPGQCVNVSATVTGGNGGPYTYTWSPNIGTGLGPFNICPTVTTTYNFTAVDANGCTQTVVASTTITVGGSCGPTVTTTNNTVCPGSCANITATGSNGTAPYTYSWNPGAGTGSSFNVCPASTTTYTVVSTDNTGKTASSTATVTVNTAPAVNISGTTTICSGTNTTLTATGGGTYLWNTGATSTSITVNPTTSTSYSVTVTTGGCTGTASVLVTVNSKPTINVSPTTICAGGTATLTAGGGGTYNWSTGESTSTINVSPLTTSSYTVTVNNSGCSSSAIATVTVGSSIVPVITGNTTICNGTSTTLSTSGGGTYAWNDGTTNTSITVNPTVSTSYSVTVTNGTCSGSGSVLVTVVNNPAPTVSGNTSVCPGTGTVLTASGGTTYVWDNGSTTTSITVSPTLSTTYTVTANTSGCTGATTVAVNITSPPIAGITGTLTICNGGSTTLIANGGGTYLWNTGATTAAITVNPTSTITYTVTVTTGCTATATVQVTVQANLVPAITGTTTICNGTSTTLSTNGGGTYAWSDGTTNQSITVNPTISTTYSVTVTNGLCSGTASQPVTVNPIPTPLITGNAVICSGQSTVLTANGGGVYLWNTGAATAGITVSPINTTSYTVTVNANGCTGLATAQVTVNPSPAPAITGITSICKGQSTTLTSTTAGPYLWNTGATSASILVTPAITTTYNVSVTQNGCTGTNTITVTVIPPVTVNITGSDICAGQSTTLTASGGTTYLWSTSETINPISISPATTTTYTVIAATGSCTDTATYIVTVNLVPTAGATGTTTISYGSDAALTATGGGTYSWSPSSGLSCTDCANPIATPTATTQYCVTVMQGSCSDLACVTITIDTKCGDNGELFVPNGFSPNGDGQNDVLYVRGGGATSIFWVIYDRWGEKVFETTDPKQGWDGTYKGNALDPAVFVYYLKVTCFSGDEISQKGNVAIIK